RDLDVSGGTVRYGTAAHRVGGTFYVRGGTADLQSATVSVHGLTGQTTGTLDLGAGTLKTEGGFAANSFRGASATLQFLGDGDQNAYFGADHPRVGVVQVDKSSGTLTFQAGFTATTLAVRAGDRVLFQATQTVAVTNLSLPGTAQAPITLDSSEPWTAWQL